MRTKKVLLGSLCLAVLAACGSRALANETSGSVPPKPAESPAPAKEDVDKSTEWLLESVEQSVSNPAERAKRIAALKKTLESLRATDREIMQKFDLPEFALPSTPTDKLFLHYMANPYRTMMTIYSTREGVDIGVQRLLNASSTLHELYMRKDMAEGIVKAYREYDPSPQSISIFEELTEKSTIRDQPAVRDPNRIIGLKKAQITLSITGADTLLMSAQFFPKLKGHERAFLKVLLERQDKITHLEKTYGEYGVGISPALCLRLAENLDSEFAARLKATLSAGVAGRAQFIEEVRRYLRN